MPSGSTHLQNILETAAIRAKRKIEQHTRHKCTLVSYEKVEDIRLMELKKHPGGILPTNKH